MSFSSWFDSVKFDSKTRRNLGLKLEALDDRIVPSVVSNTIAHPKAAVTAHTSSKAADVATQLEILAPSKTTVGAEKEIEVVALNANGRVDPDYTGTIAFTSSDSTATLPADYTFTAADRGRAVFTVTFGTSGTETLTATDTTTSTVTGSATVTVNPALVATHFKVVIEKNAYDGVATTVTVIALNANNKVVPNYTGTVIFSDTDTGATLPANYTFTAADQGEHTFSFTPSTTGSETVTVTDTATSTITGSATATITAAPTATHFAVIRLPGAFGNTTEQFLIIALSAKNKIVPNYTGTVSFSSTDKSATLPADYTFTTADEGEYVVSVTFSSSKSASLTVTDTTTSTITGTSSSHGFDNKPSSFAGMGGSC